MRHCTNGILDLLNTKFQAHIIRGPQEANERGSEVADTRGPKGDLTGPELGKGLNDSWKAKSVSKKAKGHPSKLGWELLAEIIADVSEFPPAMVSLG